MPIDTRSQWLTQLERISPIIRGYNLSATLSDFTYVGRPAGKPKIWHDVDAFDFANSEAHNQSIADAVQALRRRMPQEAIRALLGELTLRKTYGAFSELVAYKWLGDAGVDFTAQVPMTGAQVVNPNGTVADGVVMLGRDNVVNVDVKGFRFVDHKMRFYTGD